MQILEQKSDFSSRVSFGRKGSFSCAFPFSPFLIIDSFVRKSFSYDKLPQEPLKLTILKLDGSSFKIDVVKTATVAELKNAVENAFSHLPKDGPGKVSWSHVWGHFCLCYDGQKLLTDSDYIGDYEIRDGDRLLFVRHLSINYNLKRSRSSEQVADLEQPSISDVYEVGEEINGVDESCDDQEYSTPLQDDDEDNNAIITRCEYKLASIFRGWFSYHRLSSIPEPNLEQKSLLNASKSSNGLLGSFRNVVRAYSNKYNPQVETWKAE